MFFLGRLEERKNIITTIKVFEILKNEYHYKGQFLLGGEVGHGYDKIKKVINRSKNKKDIKELGFLTVEKKQQMMRGADLFLFLSLSEGFGIPILEAQSASVPVVVSNISPIKEVVGDDRAVVDLADIDKIAKVVNDILNNNDLRKSLVRAGKKNIKRFSWNKTAEKIAKEILK